MRGGRPLRLRHFTTNLAGHLRAPPHPSPQFSIEGPRAPRLKYVTPKRIKNSPKQERDINIAEDPARLESPGEGGRGGHDVIRDPKGPGADPQ